MFLPFVLAFVIATPQRHAKAPDTSAIRALYPRIDRMFERKDWKDCSRMMADNYVEDSADHRKINKRTFMKEHIAAFKPMYDIHSDVRPIDIKMEGRTATVECRYVVKAKFKDKKGPHDFRFEGSEVHRWRKEGRQWLLGYIKEHEYSVSVDNKVVQHAP